jgi:hypothetical protein
LPGAIVSDFISDATLFVKTCWRPVKVANLVRSARAAYPDLHILVADDAAPAGRANWQELVDAGADVALFPEDAGRPHCWNAAVSEHIRTTYTILCDDDELFIDTDLSPWQEFLDPDEPRLVAGAVSDRDGSHASHWVGRFERQGDELWLRHYEPVPDKPVACDYTPNFWIAPTAFLRAAPWDEEMKSCEHAGQFLRFQAAGFRCLYVPGVRITHVCAEEPHDPPEYLALRWERYPAYRELFERKWNLRPGGFHDEKET